MEPESKLSSSSRALRLLLKRSTPRAKVDPSPPLNHLEASTSRSLSIATQALRLRLKKAYQHEVSASLWFCRMGMKKHVAVALHGRKGLLFLRLIVGLQELKRLETSIERVGGSDSSTLATHHVPRDDCLRPHGSTWEYAWFSISFHVYVDCNTGILSFLSTISVSIFLSPTFE